MGLAEGDQQMFINFDQYIGEQDLNQQVASIIQQHLEKKNYYPNEENPGHGNMRIIDPFAANIEERKLSMNAKKASSIYLETTVSKLNSSHL